MGDDGKTELCTNCKRDIPSANFTIHSVHCTRNIKICQHCKEPVTAEEMKKHIAHIPCKQCGEVMQACDMGAHRSDACANTFITCPHCELSLERRLMAEHELYCGTRTERCADCDQLVMIKYRKLHQDSNHGFIKLDDEPGPQPSWNEPAPVKPSASKPRTRINPTSDSGGILSAVDLWQASNYLDGPTGDSPFNEAERNLIVNAFAANKKNPLASVRVKERHLPSVRNIGQGNALGGGDKTATNYFPAKRTNDMPQVNSAVEHPANANLMTKEPAEQLRFARGAIKKYQAPQPPGLNKKQKNIPQGLPAGSAHHSQNAPQANQPADRNFQMYEAMRREQKQAKERADKNAYNLANNLPPVLSAAEKLEKLRKMSTDYREDVEEKMNKMRKPKNNTANTNQNVNSILPTGNQAFTFTPMSNDEMNERLEKNRKREKALVNGLLGSHKNDEVGACGFSARNDPQAVISSLNEPDLYNLHQYESVNYAQWSIPPNVAAPAEQEAPVAENFDRIMEIKKSLRVLRKELDECTSPLEPKKINRIKNVESEIPKSRKKLVTNTALDLPISTSPNLPKQKNERLTDHRDADHVFPSPDMPMHRSGEPISTVMLPCEFCERMIPTSELTGHAEKCSRNTRVQHVYANDLSPSAAPTLLDDSPPNNIKKSEKKAGHRNSHKERNNFTPQKNNNESPHFHSDLSDVMLPCEFCQKMIAANFLVAHETGCNPLVTSFSPPGASPNESSPSSNASAATAPPNTPDGIPFNKASNVNRAIQNNSNDAQHFNGRPSRRNIVRNDSKEVLGAANFDEEEAVGVTDEVMLPCEFCMTLFPAGSLMQHQESCYND